MEIIIGTEALRNELRSFNGLVDRSNTLMEMSNLLIQTVDDKLYLSGTDGDVTLRAELHADAFEAATPGALCIRADKLTDVLATLDSSVRSIRIKSEEKGWSNILFGKSRFRIAGVETQAFPDIKPSRKPETIPVNFPAGLLLQFLNSTSHAVSSQDTRYALTGANLRITEEGAQMEAADGFKVARIKAPVMGKLTALFPKKATATLKRMLGDVSPEVLVEISEETNHLFAVIGTKHLSFRRLVGKFPFIDQLLNIENELTALIDLYPLQAAVRRADLFADKQNHSSVALTFRPGELEIHSRSFEVGSGNELIEAKYDGPELTVKITCSSLLSFFSSINSSEEPTGNVTLNIAFSADEKKATIWKVHRAENMEIGYDYECLITKLR